MNQQDRQRQYADREEPGQAPRIGMPAPPGIAEPGSNATVHRGSRIRWIAGGIAAILTVLTLCCCGGVLVSPLGSEVSPFGGGGKPARRLAVDAREGLSSSQAIRYRGVIVAPDGSSTTVDLVVGRGGLSSGKATRDGASARVLRSGEQSYLLGDRDFWLAHRPEQADVFGERWVQVSNHEFGVDLGSELNPRTLAETIQRRVGESGPTTLTKQGIVTVDDRQAVQISTRSGLTLYVDAESPHRLVRLSGTMGSHGIGGGGLAPEGSAGADESHVFEFDIDDQSPRHSPELEDQVRRLSAELGGAADLEKPTTLPARYTITRVTPSCNASACTATVTVRNLYGPPARGTRGTMLATLTASTADGPTLGSCASVAVPVSLVGGQATSLRCAVVGGAWASWARATRRGTYWWRVVVHSPGWNGPSPALLQRLLNRSVDSQLITQVGQRHGRAGLEVLERLMALPAATRDRDRITPEETRRMLDQAAELRILRDVHTLTTSGRMHNPTSIRAVVNAAHEGFRKNRILGHVREIQEAAGRVRSSRGPIAIESWQRPGKTYGADVIDVGRREAIQLKSLSGARVRERIEEGGVQFTGKKGEHPPPGFRKIILISVDTPRNELFSLKRGALLRALKRAEVKRADLGPADELIIVNRTGRHAFRPSEIG